MIKKEVCKIYNIHVSKYINNVNMYDIYILYIFNYKIIKKK